MQKAFATILLLAFLGQTFNQGFFYVDYLVQKKEYAKRCVNKARPSLHCNGKCLMMKKIEEQQRKEQGQPPEMKLGAKMEVLSSKSSFLLSFEASNTAIKQHFFSLDSGLPVDQSPSIFHPPPCC